MFYHNPLSLRKIILLKIYVVVILSPNLLKAHLDNYTFCTQQTEHTNVTLPTFDRAPVVTLITGIWLLTSMDTHMPFKVGGHFEGSITHHTCIWFITSMSTKMNLQLTRRTATIWAYLTSEKKNKQEKYSSRTW